MDSDLKNADSELFVEFYLSKRENSMGKPYVRIMTPGSKDCVDQPLRESHKDRFPLHWANFERKNQGLESIGTTLAHWRSEQPTAISEGQLEALINLKFQTVDQLANSSDAQLQTIGMGGIGLRTKAQQYVKERRFGMANAESDKLKGEVARLTEMVNQLMAKGKPGPKAKTTEE